MSYQENGRGGRIIRLACMKRRPEEGTYRRCSVFMVCLFVIVSIFGIIPHYTLAVDPSLPIHCDLTIANSEALC